MMAMIVNTIAGIKSAEEESGRGYLTNWALAHAGFLACSTMLFFQYFFLSQFSVF